jgi:hypothetical protein
MLSARAAPPRFSHHPTHAGEHVAGPVAQERGAVATVRHLQRHRSGDVLRIGPREASEGALSMRRAGVVL